MKLKEILQEYGFALIILMIFTGIILLIVIFPNHKAHDTISNYLKIVLSIPGVIIISSFLLIYIIRLIFFSKTRTEFAHIEKPDITGFINIIENTEEGNIIIKNEEKYNIEDKNVIVNEAFILKFLENKKKVKSLEEEIEKYREKLLEI